MTAVNKQSNSSLAVEDKPLTTGRQSWQAWLLSLADLRYGVISVRILLVVVILVALFPIEFSIGPRSETPATMFAWLPLGLLRNGVFFTSVRVGLVVAALLWWWRIWTPVSCWLTVGLGVLLWSLRMEGEKPGETGERQ